MTYPPPKITDLVEYLRDLAAYEKDAVTKDGLKRAANRIQSEALSLKIERDMTRALSAEVDALRADAERYRHLKAYGDFHATSLDINGKCELIWIGRVVGESSTLDEAIDAAIADAKDDAERSQEEPACSFCLCFGCNGECSGDGDMGGLP